MSESAYEAAARVVDPELRVVNIAELGILRSVRTDGPRAVVTVTPTYSGCPAMDVIRADVVAAVQAAGWSEVEVLTQLHPAWSTDWLAASGRAKLAEAGIAPPGPAAPVLLGLPASRSVGDFEASGDPGSPKVPDTAERGAPDCPRCGASRTTELSRFGSTACKALWRCQECQEPFEQVKAI